MRQAQDVLNIRTRGLGHHEITQEVASWVAGKGLRTGLLTIFIQHVLASLTIRQPADRDDLHSYFARLEGLDEDIVPRPTTLYATALNVPIRDGILALGPRQGIYLLEQRDSPQTRQIVLHLIGE